MKNKLLGIEVRNFTFQQKDVLVTRIKVLRIFNGRNTKLKGYLNVPEPSFSIRRVKGKVMLLAEDSLYKAYLSRFRAKKTDRAFVEESLLKEGKIYTPESFADRLKYIKKAGERFTKLNQELRAEQRKNTQIIYI